MSEYQSETPPLDVPALSPSAALDVAATGGVQRKVSFSTAAAYVSGLALAAVVQSLQDGSLIAALPPVASAILAPLVPAALVLLTGYMTTNRVDPGAVKGFAAAVQAQLAAQVEARVVATIDRYLDESSFENSEIARKLKRDLGGVQ